MTKQNIFSNIPKGLEEEFFEQLLSNEVVTLERIVSCGQATPAGEWYDQEQNEWVILLTGGAGLVFEGVPETINMGPGDYVHIPAHVKHRVEWTDEECTTVWLALHYPNQ